MASSEAMKIIEATKVFPSSTTATSFDLPLSFFDIMWFKEPPVEEVYFYQIPKLKSNSFNSLIIPKLKNSLSQTLLHHLPIAGNLIWHGTKPIIRHAPPGDGVSFVVAEFNNAADFNRLSCDEPHEAISLHPLIPPLMSTDDVAALFGIQVTLFQNQGFCIGVSIHHGLFDAKSFTTFMNSWAYLCKSQGSNNNQKNKFPPSLPVNLSPVFDRSVIKDPIRLDTLYLDHLLQHFTSNQNISLKVSQNTGVMPSDFVRATFRFTLDDIKKIRERIKSKWGGEGETPIPHFSTFLLTVAYLITCRVKARGGEKQRKVFCSFLINYRKRLNPRAPENYFGNCVGVRDLETKKAGDFMDEENGLVFAVKLLNDGFRGISSFEMDEEVQKKYIKHFFNFSKRKSEGQSISVTASPQFGDYEADFGWGRPKKVEIVSIDRTGSMSLIQAGDGNGEIEIGLALEKHEMESFALLFRTGLMKWCHGRSAL